MEDRKEVEFGYDVDGEPLDLVDIMSDSWGAVAGWTDYLSEQYDDL